MHDDVVKWKHFPRYWPFVRGIHRFPDEAYENNNTFFYIILEYDRPNLDRFLPRGSNIWLVWQGLVNRNLQRL